MKPVWANPARLLLGAIFQKEVRVLGRRRGTYVARASFALGLIAIVSLFFIGVFVDDSTGIQRLQTLQSLAPSLMLVILWFQFVTLALMAPTLTSDGICEERRSRTLSALLTTPLTAGEIVVGKLASRLVQIVILALLSLPLLLAMRIFGGLSAEVVLASVAIILSTALLGASLGLLCSIWNRRSSTAAGQAAMALGLVQFGPWIAEGLRVHVMERLGTAAFAHHEIHATSSPIVLGYLTSAAMMGAEIPETTVALGSRFLALGPTWAVNSLYNLFVAALVVVGASLVLRRSMRRLANEAPPPPRRTRWWVYQRSRKPAGAAAPAAADGQEAQVEREERNAIERPVSRTVRGNPVLWREMRQQTMGSRRKLVLAVVAVVAAAGIMYWRIGMHESELHIMIAIIAALALLAQAAYTTSNTISSEREGQTWEALLATPLTARQILLGKCAGALRSQWFLFAMLLAHFTIAAACIAVHPAMPLVIVLIIGGPVILLTATGQFLALALRRGTMAAGANLCVGLALFVGSWVMVGGIALMFPEEPRWFRALVNTLYAIHPVTLCVAATEHDWSGAGPGHWTVYMGSRRISGTAFVIVVMFVFSAYVAAAAGVFWITCRSFGRLSGRAR